MREGEGEMGIRHGQQIGELGAAPGVARATLALRAVTVAEGTEHALLAATLIALLARAAQRGGAARDDVAPDTGLRGMHRRSGAESLSQPRSLHSSLRRRPLE